MSSGFPKNRYRGRRAAAALILLFCTGLVSSSGVAGAGAKPLRVCADPNNLPFSRSDGSGFENRIARIVASALGRPLEFAWHGQHRGFIRKSLKAGHCDVIMGVPADLDMVRTTRPYYRSSYVFVRRAADPAIRSFADPRLKTLTIGVQLVGDDGANTPPVHEMAGRDIRNLRGFMIYGDDAQPAPLAAIFDAVADGTVDVAVAWGPEAGYFASRRPVPLSLAPVEDLPGSLSARMTFDIAMGVRKEDKALALELDSAIERRAGDIARVLDAYKIPRMRTTRAEGEPR